MSQISHFGKGHKAVSFTKTRRGHAVDYAARTPGPGMYEDMDAVLFTRESITAFSLPSSADARDSYIRKSHTVGPDVYYPNN